MARIDHHIHTTRHSPDSFIDPDDLIDRAREAGLDGVVITEHDRLWEPDELAELQARAGELTVLSGVEVSAREGHFLVYGLTDLDECPPGVRLQTLLEVVEAQGAAIVAAHPFRWDQDFEGIVARHGPVFDALELVSNNVTPDMREQIEAMLGRFPSMGATGSSDAHDPMTVGCYFTEFPGSIRTLAEFVSALKARSGRPRHRQGVALVGGPVV
ncbi:PHP-associated domain-containing protein [Tautonia sociabilis]|uniref:PHP domain-containing protein n=1 Tax=Tautonia sociabilis TaxID=2080755 RepID=A0A432MQQ7_9BACT|nr:PHP-associated domain-containing protein [Tautonia sociabilis]RUL89700.1 PHP domain-containing protein [Tautonia sociabilis]